MTEPRYAPDHTRHETSPNPGSIHYNLAAIAERIAVIGKALDEIQRSRIQCVGCWVEHHAGQRDTINPATLIVGGNSTCESHVQIGTGPALPDRTPSGIVIPGPGPYTR
jgi:hypothetical protein